MSKISLYELAPAPKLSDRLIGTSVGFDSQNQTYNQTYNFSLQELLDLFIPSLTVNTLQGVLNNGNTATQDIHLNGTIYTTNLDVASSAHFTDVYLLGQTYLQGQLSDSVNNIGSVGQVLVSFNTGGTKWQTLSYVPLTRTITINGETHDLSINRTWTVATGVMDITTSSPLGTSGGATPNLSIQKASSTLDGYLSSTDWNTFNNKGTGSVTSVTATTPLVSTGGTTPNLTILQSGTSTNGYLSSADWNTFNNKQGAITLTTTGTSGAATFAANTLNIPNYADGGVLSLSAIGAVPNANAGTITGTVLNLQPADASFGGVVTTGTQTFAGAKTFSVDATINTLTVGLGHTSIATNTVVGYEALNSNTTGDTNIAIGYRALNANTTASNNAAVGRSALYNNTTGANNTAIGNYALFSNTTSSNNSAVGFYALYNNTTGTLNTGIGQATLYKNTAGL
jgi:hypothetical protein